MGFKSDIEIAQEAQPKKITEIAAGLGIDEKYIEQYGHYKAKIDYNYLKDHADAPDGKLSLVTAITPTPAGEGKTTTSVGLADGLRAIGKKTVVALREPSDRAVWLAWHGEHHRGRDSALYEMEGLNPRQLARMFNIYGRRNNIHWN